jgi:GNAT superfamily N-acetyltransferase
VKCFGLVEPASEATIDELVELFRPVGAPFRIYLSPVVRPEGLEAMLEAKGFTRVRSSAKVYRSMSNLPEPRTDLLVTEVGAEARPDVVRALAGGFGMPAERGEIVAERVAKPDWRWFLAYDGDEPAGVGALFVMDGAGWLGYGATLPEYRGRGAQTSIIAARVAAASEMGCEYVTSDTWEDTLEEPVTSYRNMVRNGFELLYVRPTFEYRFES